MRYIFGFLCIFPLGPMLPLGCGEADGALCEAMVCHCTEEGIRFAIAAGGGPYTFDCDGPTVIAAGFSIDGQVILDGEGKLETDAIHISAGAAVELRGFHIENQFIVADQTGLANFGDLQMIDCIVGGFEEGGVFNHDEGSLALVNSSISANWHVGIRNKGTLSIMGSTVSGNLNGADYEETGAGIHNVGMLTITNSTVWDNRDLGLRGSGGIYNAGGVMAVTNSTISGNESYGAAGLFNAGTLTIVNSTVSGNADGNIQISNEGTVTVVNSLVDGGCEGEITSGGYNIESLGNTCGFDTNKGDLFDVTAEQLSLGPLQDNGGPTETHALLPGSIAIDRIPEAECRATEDQRGEPRPETGGTLCDVGAFELTQGNQ